MRHSSACQENDVEASKQALLAVFGEESLSLKQRAIQYSSRQVTNKFELKSWLDKWRKELGRTVEVVGAFRAATHLNPVAPFQCRVAVCRPMSSVVSDATTDGESAGSSGNLDRRLLDTSHSHRRDLEQLIKQKPLSRMPLNNKGTGNYEVWSHYQRVVPQLYQGHAKRDRHILYREPAEMIPGPCRYKLERWLQQRCIFQKYQAVEETASPWKGHEVSNGTYFRCILRESEVFPGFDLLDEKVGFGRQMTMSPEDGKLSGCSCWGQKQEYRPAIHASSLYSHMRIMHHGLQGGAATKQDVRGLYCFPMDESKFRKKSSGYNVYSELFGDGVYWTVSYELQVARFLAGSEAYLILVLA
jgi:hypothetical protein